MPVRKAVRSVARIAVVFPLLASADLSAQALRFVESDQYVSEKSDGARLVVRRAWPGTGLLTARFHTTNGTATAGQDFLTTTGTLSFATDGAEETIFVPLKDDCAREGQESLSVVLRNLVSEELTRATVHLGDDETPGNIEQRLGAGAGLAADLIVPLKDGRYLVNGANGIIRLNADFSLDTTFQLELPENFHDRSRITYFTVSSNGLMAATAASFESEGFYDKYLGTFDQAGRRLSWQIINHRPLELVGPLVWESDESLLLGIWDWDGVIRRFSKSGILDPDFQSPTNLSFITALALQPDGKILATTGADVIRLLQNGALDSSFAAPGAHGPFGSHQHIPMRSALPEPILVKDDGTVFVSRLRVHEDDVACEIVRLDTNGALHSIIPVSTETNYPAFVSQLVLQADGKLLVAGSFDSFNGHPCPGLVRLHVDGTLDQTFALGFPFLSAHWVALDGHGRFLVTGGPHWASSASHVYQLFADRVLRWRPPVQDGWDLVCQADVAIGDRLILQTSTNLSLWQDRSTNLASDCRICFTNTALPRQEFFRLKRVN